MIIYLPIHYFYFFALPLILFSRDKQCKAWLCRAGGAGQINTQTGLGVRAPIIDCYFVFLR